MSTVTVNRGAQGPPILVNTDRVVVFDDFNYLSQSTFTVVDMALAGGFLANADGTDVSTAIGAMITPELESGKEMSFLFRAKLDVHNGDTEFDCGFANAAGTAAAASHSFAIALACGTTPADDVVICYLDDNNATRSETAVTLSQTSLGASWDPAQWFEFGGTLKQVGAKYHAKYYVNGVLVATIVDDVPVPITGHFDAGAMGLFATQAAGTGLVTIDYVYADLPRS
jgi:hypothetical protein